MAVLDSIYSTPSGIGWTVNYSTSSGTFQNYLDVPKAGVTAYVWWRSPSHTFQFQYRYRSRYIPSVAILTDPTGADVWTAWSAWGGVQSDGNGTPVDGGVLNTNYYEPQRLPYDNNRIFTTPFTFTHDVSTYDMVEYELRVRVYNYPNYHCSEWRTERTKIRFRPQATAAVAAPQGSREYELAIDVAWERPLSEAIYQLLGDKNSYAFPASSDGDQSANVWAMPSSLSYTGYLALKKLALYGDGTCAVEFPAALGVLTNPERIPIAAHTPGVVPAYTATYDASDLTGLVLNVTTASAVDGVSMAVTWVDARGNEYIEQLESEDVNNNGKVWEATLINPPLDVELTWLYSITVSGDWKQDSEKLTVNSNGLCLLDGFGEHFQIKYNPEVAFDYDGENEAIAIAGKKLPVVRYGEHSKREVTLKGIVLNPDFDESYGDMWHSDLNNLDNPHQWLLRLPGGYRQNVTIESADLSGDVGSSGKWLEVSISMQEVG